MQAAVVRIVKAIDQQEKVMIYGDYDVDGTTSVALVTSYFKDNTNRGFCGIINIYNFLADSYKFNRVNDLGYLIARIFINNENHYMVQGKRQLGFLYNDIINAVIDKESMQAIIESAILYSLDFDLFVPPYDEVKEVSVYEMQRVSEGLRMKTGKRLGFRFQADTDEL